MTFLERLWAYVTLGAMGFVWEEASPLIGGVAAYDRHLALGSVILAVALGTWGAGGLLYALGRWQGYRVRKSWRKLRPAILQSVAIVRRNPWRAALAVRFAYGLRVPLPIACGIGRVPIPIYVVGTAVSCLIWSTVFTVLGWWLGQTAETLIGTLRRWVPLIGTLIVVAVVGVYLVFRRRHVVERTVRVLERQRRPYGETPAGDARPGSDSTTAS